MNNSIYKMSDAEFSVWLENFGYMVDENLAALHLTAADLTAIQNVKTVLKGALAEKQTANEIRKAKTADLRAKRKAALKKIAFYNKTLKANEAIPAAVLAMLGLNFADAASGGSPSPPTALLVEGFSNGINQLRWKKNGGARNFYIVEARLETETQFSYVGGTNKSKFVHKNQKPGARMFYRVKAQRNEEESPYSNEAVVY